MMKGSHDKEEHHVHPHKEEKDKEKEDNNDELNGNRGGFNERRAGYKSEGTPALTTHCPHDGKALRGSAEFHAYGFSHDQLVSTMIRFHGIDCFDCALTIERRYLP